MSVPHIEAHNQANSRSAAAVLVAWWRDWTHNMASRSELAACSADEVDRMARDVGLSSVELQRLARHRPDEDLLLFRRMGALDLDPADVAEADRATFLDLERVCTFCDCKGRCKRDLARNADDAVWKDYCPNVATLKMLEALHWAGRRER